MNCKICGQPIAEGSKFCVFCGTAVPVEPPKNAFCSNCGKQLVPGARFCANCGKPVNAPVVDTPAPVVPPVVEPAAPKVTPITEPVTEVVAPAVDPFALPVTEPVAPVVDPFALPVTEPVAPAVDPFAVPVTEPAAPVVDPFAVPVTEPAAPVVDPFAVPVTEPVAPAVDPFAVPVTETETPAIDPFTIPAVNYFPDNGPTPAPAPFESTPQKPSKPKKRRRALPIILSVIAGILVLAIVAGLLTNWFGLYGPTAKIRSATLNTLEEESFTLTVSTEDSEMVYEVRIDFKNEDLTIVAVDEEGSITGGIYDGYLIKYSDFHNCYTCSDATEIIEAFFRVYQFAEDMDIEELFEDQDMEDIKKTMDLKELKSSLASLYLKANNNRWLTENAGFSKESSGGVTTFTFNPDLYRFAVTVFDEFEDAYLDDDDFEDMMDSLDESKKLLSKIDVELSVGIKSGRVNNIGIVLDADLGGLLGSIDTTIDVEFSRIGTTGIDTETMDGILSDARNIDD